MKEISLNLQNNAVFSWEDCVSSSYTELEINHYPWYENGTQQNTHVFLAMDSENIYLRAVAEDKWIYAQERELNGSVHQDSCVEFFVSPGPLGSAYFNFEVNCVGMIHLAWGPDRDERTLCTQAQANQIQIKTSEMSKSRNPKPGDQAWWLEMTIPMSLLQEMSGQKISPANFQDSQIEWHANFYRCGGIHEPQYAVWNEISTENPDYHRPESFGRILIKKS